LGNIIQGKVNKEIEKAQYESSALFCCDLPDEQSQTR